MGAMRIIHCIGMIHWSLLVDHPLYENSDYSILTKYSGKNASVNPEMRMRKYLFLYFYLKSCIDGWAFRITLTGSTTLRFHQNNF